jgi:alpha-glucosidase
VASEAGDPGSMLELDRRALRIRRAEPALGDGPMSWRPAPDGVLSFDRTAAGGGPVTAGSGRPGPAGPAEAG